MILMKKRCFGLFVLIMLLLAVSAASAAVSDDDGTVSRYSARRLYSGRSYTIQWSDSSFLENTYYAKFTAASKGYVSLKLEKMIGDFMGYFEISIYDGVTKCWSTNTFGNRSAKKDQFRIGLEPGSYELRITEKGHFTYPVKLKYTFSYSYHSHYEAEPNNSTYDATPIQLNTMYTGVFGDEYDFPYKDYYVFRAEAGKNYQFRMANYASMAKTLTLLELIDSSGRTDSLTFKINQQSAGNFNYYDFTADRSGDCYIVFSNATYPELFEYEIGVYESRPAVTKNGLTKDSDGIWRYYENGVFVPASGIAEFEGGYFFVANGLLCADVNGLASFDDQWFFLSGGQIQIQYTGLALYDGHWLFVRNGMFDPNLNGLVDYDGSQFVVAAGEVIRGINGLWQNTDGAWYYLADGQVVTYYTGLTQYDGAWFYVINGRLATEFTGDVEYDGAIFWVVNGEVFI